MTNPFTCMHPKLLTCIESINIISSCIPWKSNPWRYCLLHFEFHIPHYISVWENMKTMSARLWVRVIAHL